MNIHIFSLKKSVFLAEFSADSVPKFPICKCERPRISVNVPPASLPSYFTPLRYTYIEGGGRGGRHECVWTVSKQMRGNSLVCHCPFSFFWPQMTFHLPFPKSVLNWEENETCRLPWVFKGSDQWEGSGFWRSPNHYILVGEVVLDVFLSF
jgi:hypothetical protein